jgi:hypothetical protein
MLNQSDFTPSMLSFLQWFFCTLDSEFTEQFFAGRSVEEVAEQVFGDIVATMRGNRAMEGELTPIDYGAVMDRIAALHLRTRHGEASVPETTVS